MESSSLDVKTQPAPRARFEDGLTQNSQEILSKIKWQLDFTQKKHGESFDPENVKKQLDGLLRGDFAERLSQEYEPQQCRTVYNPSGLDTTQYKITSFESITNQKTKEGILAFAVKKSLKDSPPKMLTRYLNSSVDTEAKSEALLDQVTKEIVDGYSSKGMGANSGILFGDTVIPDGALINSKGEIVGAVEVKAYYPEELHRLVVRLNKDKEEGGVLKTHTNIEIREGVTTKKLNLGVDLNRELEFVDIVRSVGFGLSELDTNMPVILRLANDIPDELIVKYGEILTECGYKVVLQKIPITTDELSKKAKEFVKNNMESITDKTKKGLTYSDREIEVLKSYSQ